MCYVCWGNQDRKDSKRLSLVHGMKELVEVDLAMTFLRDSRLGPEVEVVPGVLEKECSEALSEYFKSLRD